MEHGGKVTSSVTKTTDYLLAGKKPGTKLDKANNGHTMIIGETEFVDMLN